MLFVGSSLKVFSPLLFLTVMSAYSTVTEKNVNSSKILFNNKREELGNALDVTHINLMTGQNGTSSFNVEQGMLDANGMTREDFATATVITEKDGNSKLLLKSGREIDLSIRPEAMVKFADFLGGYSMSQRGLLARTLDDIKDEPDLVPLPHPKLEWPSPPYCSLTSLQVLHTSAKLRIYLNDINVPIFEETVRAKPSITWGLKLEGVTLLTLDPLTCQVTFNKSILMAEEQLEQGKRELMWTIKEITPGTIVLLMSLGDASKAWYEIKRKVNSFPNIKETNRRRYVTTNDTFLIAFVKSGKVLGETLVKRIEYGEDVQSNHIPSPVTLHLDFGNLNTFKQKASRELCSNWPAEEMWEKRRIFCKSHMGLGSFCDCNQPFQLKTRSSGEIGPDDIPMVIVTGGRPRLLFRLIESVGHQTGVYSDMFLIALDGYENNTLQFANILGLRVVIHRKEHHERGAVMITMNLRFGLYNSLKVFPKAKAFIVLEDDLILSPDFYAYMKHLQPLFEIDKTVFCVNAFNHLSFNHTAKDPSRLYRVHSMPAYGWMVSRDIAKYILPKFLPKVVLQDWDMFMWNDFVRKGRSVIIPDINRSYHGSYHGIHAALPWFNERYYLSRPYNQDPNAKLMPIQDLVLEAYDREMHNTFRRAKYLDSWKEFNDTVNNTSDTNTYYLYVRMKNEKDVSTLTTIGKNLNLWDMDARDAYYATWRFNYDKKTYLIAGYPLSIYRKYKPKGASILFAGIEEYDDADDKVNSIIRR